MRTRTSTLAQRPFDPQQSADFPAALQIKNEHSYTEHALRVFDGVHSTTITVCGKRVTPHAYSDGGWHITQSDNLFKYVTNFSEARSHTITIPETGEQHTYDYPTYISPLACKTCVRLVFGYVACVDCIPDYNAFPTIRETWIQSRTRGARCPAHTQQYTSTQSLQKGIQASDEHGIVVHQENRREHIKHVIHVTLTPTATHAHWAPTACGRRMQSIGGHYYTRKYGLIDEVKPYSARLLRRARKNGARVCPQCETYMRKRGYAVA